MAELLKTPSNDVEPVGLLASMMTRRSLLRFMVASVGIAAAGSLLAACGGDDDDNDDTGSGATGDATATSGSAPAATDEPDDDDDDDDPTEEPAADPTEEPDDDDDDATEMTGDDDDDTGETHTVEMTTDLVFAPAELTIKAGDTVTWVVVGEFPHSSTCDPAKTADPTHAVLPEGADPWDSGILQDAQEFTRTFDVAGDYTYFCIPHESMGMLGKLTVEA